MNTLPKPRPLAVVILDGWGVSFSTQGNAIAEAETPTMDLLARYFPTATLAAASIEVGLPWGEVGNSETGHRNIGAGSVQYQVLPMIDKAIKDGSFFSNSILQGAIEHAQARGSALHIMGLLSNGGIHAHINHLEALLKMIAGAKIKNKVFIHVFTDGRDTEPQSAERFINELNRLIDTLGVGDIASVTGRFYAMDRNENWERTKATYEMLTGVSRQAGAPTALAAVQQSYAKLVFDENIAPTVLTRGGMPKAKISDGDAVVFFNFRPDRARQLTRAFVEEAFAGWPRQKLKDLYFATMAQYDKEIAAPFAFMEEVAENPLAKIIAEAGLKQLHIAETEKYAHVTYYLNVGHEELFTGEDRVLIKSSGVKNFADKPEMEAGIITDRVLQEVQAGKYDVYFVNFANPDMVGHTGDFEATKKACSFVDQNLGRIYEAVVRQGGGALLVTADHGNAEEMINSRTGKVTTDHSTNPVPLYYAHPRLARQTPRSDEEVQQIMSAPIGVLSDVAPTILEILNIPAHPDMTGVSLLGSLR